MAGLAEAVGAKPYSYIRRQRELTTNTVNFEEPATGRDQRTTITVKDFRGWDLPGPRAGSLEYQEQTTETVWVDRPSREAVTPVQTASSRSCKLQAPVANARAIFEIYEGLTREPYGIRISADRRWVDVFMFDPDQFDIELRFVLQRPLAGLLPDTAQREGRIALSDGGPRFIGGANEGIPIVGLARAALLAGLDQPATMDFMNEEIGPVVQRLTAR